MLAFRRQHHQEIATVLTDRDAAERRITDLYSKAAEQIGSDQASVRLAGLYALERLAQDNPGHRQTIVNVICAYLRMPYNPPADWVASLTGTASKSRRNVPKAGSAAYNELQVRLTAESILFSHMRDGRKRDERSSLLADSSFWEGTDLDLGGASLVNAICWVGCRLDFANFNGARFVDGVNFAHAEFGQVFFIDSRFEEGNAHFYNAWFGDRAVFFGTNFGTHEATFKEAHFHGIAFFDDAKFG